MENVIMKQILKHTRLFLIGALLLISHNQSAASWFSFGGGEKKDEPGWIAKTLADTLKEPIKALKKTIKNMGEEIPKSLDNNLQEAAGKIIVSIEDIILGKEEGKKRAGGLDKKIEKIIESFRTKLTQQLDKSSQDLITKLCDPISEKLLTVDQILKNLNDSLFNDTDPKTPSLIKKTNELLGLAEKTLTQIDTLLDKKTTEEIKKTIKALHVVGTKTNQTLEGAKKLIKNINQKLESTTKEIKKTLKKYQDLKDEISEALDEYKKIGESGNTFINGVSGLWTAFLGTRNLPWASTVTNATLGIAAFNFFTSPLTSILLGLGSLAYYHANPLGEDITAYTNAKKTDPNAQFKFTKTEALFSKDKLNLGTWIGGGLALGLFSKIIR